MRDEIVAEDISDVSLCYRIEVNKDNCMPSNALEGHDVNVTSMHGALEWTVVSGVAHDDFKEVREHEEKY